eukprot:1290119-Amphidinium_carterae.2
MATQPDYVLRLSDVRVASNSVKFVQQTLPLLHQTLVVRSRAASLSRLGAQLRTREATEWQPLPSQWPAQIVSRQALWMDHVWSSAQNESEPCKSLNGLCLVIGAE